jgi:hypothetical protein
LDAPSKFGHPERAVHIDRIKVRSNGTKNKSKKMSFRRFIAEEAVFCLLIAFIVSLLYANSLQGTFIWDDRAAVVRSSAQVLRYTESSL